MLQILQYTFILAIIFTSSSALTSRCNPSHCVHGVCEDDICRCKPGYTGSRCDKCIPLAGCQSGYCNKPDECICEQNYTGELCDNLKVRIDYCLSFNPCKNGGICKKDPHDPTYQYYCLCVPGFTGRTCDTHLADPVSKKPTIRTKSICKNKGFCTKKIGGNCVECSCAKGFYGKFCQKQLSKPQDICSAALCAHGQICIPKGKMFECVCSPAYLGQDCKQKKNVCAEHNPCFNGGICINNSPSYKCVCVNGFTGSRCQKAQYTDKSDTKSLPTTGDVSKETIEGSISRNIRIQSGKVEVKHQSSSLVIQGDNISVESVGIDNLVKHNIQTSPRKSSSSLLAVLCYVLIVITILLCMCTLIYFCKRNRIFNCKQTTQNCPDQRTKPESYELKSANVTRVIINSEQDMLLQKPEATSVVTSSSSSKSYKESQKSSFDPQRDCCSNTLAKKSLKVDTTCVGSCDLCDSGADCDTFSEECSSLAGKRYRLSTDVTII